MQSDIYLPPENTAKLFHFVDDLVLYGQCLLIRYRMLVTRERKSKVHTLLPDSYSYLISVDRVDHDSRYPWMCGIDLAGNRTRLDRLIHDKVDLSGNRLKPRYRSHSHFSITGYS
jgi:hypothetical protein